MAEELRDIDYQCGIHPDPTAHIIKEAVLFEGSDTPAPEKTWCMEHCRYATLAQADAELSRAGPSSGLAIG